MSELRASIAVARERLIEGLHRAGFRLLDGRALVGEIDIAGVAVEHEIVVPDDFPIDKPKVRTPGGEGGMSWHRDVDGGFCLWSDDEASHLPWAEAGPLLDRIRQWHANDAAGWPDDAPDLDLQRYWPQGNDLILHDDLDRLVAKQCKVVRGRYGVYRLEPGAAARKKSKVYGAAVVDIGELDRPVHTFHELVDRLSATDGAALRNEIQVGRTRIVLVRYSRQGHVGSLALLATERNPNTMVALQTAHSGESSLRLRCGFDADALAESRVAIVGLGAIGSLLADLLPRSGVGQLTLVDNSVIRPGNCVRHLVTREHVGRPKVEAVRDHLMRAGVVAGEAVHTSVSRLSSVDVVEALFSEHDLVVDATGNGPATALILTASRTLGRPAVTVCLQRGGTVARVDRSPLRPGEVHAPPVPPGSPHPDQREGGCGDPVSPSPPWACTAAAARAAGMVVDLLTGRRQYPPTVVDVLVADAHPLDEIGTLR